jgi:hypothetical protein
MLPAQSLANISITQLGGASQILDTGLSMLGKSSLFKRVNDGGLLVGREDLDTLNPPEKNQTSEQQPGGGKGSSQ